MKLKEILKNILKLYKTNNFEGFVLLIQISPMTDTKLSKSQKQTFLKINYIVNVLNTVIPSVEIV